MKNLDLSVIYNNHPDLKKVFSVEKNGTLNFFNDWNSLFRFYWGEDEIDKELWSTWKALENFERKGWDFVEWSKDNIAETMRELGYTITKPEGYSNG